MGSDDTHVFTDHRNFLYVFHPTSIYPGLGRHLISKLQRSALFLSHFPCHIAHVRGEKNIMADMMTQWYCRYRGKRSSQMARHVSRRSTERNKMTSGDQGLPTDEEVRAVQMTTGHAPLKVSSKRNRLLTVNSH